MSLCHSSLTCEREMRIVPTLLVTGMNNCPSSCPGQLFLHCLNLVAFDQGQDGVGAEGRGSKGSEPVTGTPWTLPTPVSALSSQAPTELSPPHPPSLLSLKQCTCLLRFSNHDQGVEGQVCSRRCWLGCAILPILTPRLWLCDLEQLRSLLASTTSPVK